MSEFLSGVVTCGYLVIAGILAVLWYRKPDPLYRAFTVAFVLFALNQALAAALVTTTEPSSLIYALRVLGFVIILGALLDRDYWNRFASTRRATTVKTTSSTPAPPTSQ
jgi:peptidoglycan/LPS O-acetylase OafA/YrhL